MNFDFVRCKNSITLHITAQDLNEFPKMKKKNQAHIVIYESF